MKIEILSTQLIKPSSLTPPELRDFKLSFIDERIPHSYIPLILYYTLNEDSSSNINQSEMCRRLKSSLSKALALYYPLAGRMKGQISVDCNDNGVLYAEASADGNVIDIVRSPHPQILDKLVPFITNGYASNAQEQLAVQITSFNCGAIVIGMCISHRIADVSTLSSFIKCWAATTTATTSHDVSATLPLFNSAALFPPRNTPDFSPKSNGPTVQPLSSNLITRRFVFPSSAIEALKLQAAAAAAIPPVIKPTRVEVITAFIWHRCMAAKGIKNLDRSVAYHAVNLRGKIPALSDNSFGNLFQMTKAESGGETDWIKLVGKIRAAFEDINDEYVEKLLGEKGIELAKENFMEIGRLLREGNVEVFRFSSYCRIGVNEADFGWGRPIWVSNSNYRNKNCVFLFDSVGCKGGIEAMIAMSEEDMGRLEEDLEFLRLTYDSTDLLGLT